MIDEFTWPMAMSSGAFPVAFIFWLVILCYWSGSANRFDAEQQRRYFEAQDAAFLARDWESRNPPEFGGEWGFGRELFPRPELFNRSIGESDLEMYERGGKRSIGFYP